MSKLKKYIPIEQGGEGKPFPKNEQGIVRIVNKLKEILPNKSKGGTRIQEYYDLEYEDGSICRKVASYLYTIKALKEAEGFRGMGALTKKVTRFEVLKTKSHYRLVYDKLLKVRRWVNKEDMHLEQKYPANKLSDLPIFLEKRVRTKRFNPYALTGRSRDNFTIFCNLSKEEHWEWEPDQNIAIVNDEEVHVEKYLNPEHEYDRESAQFKKFVRFYKKI